MHLVALTQVDPTTFDYPYAYNFRDMPVGTDISIYVVDNAISPGLNLASDIYVNGTKVTVTQVGTQEYGTFRLSSEGSVY